MRLYRVGFSGAAGFFRYDRYAALRADHIFYKEGGLTHHRPPACFIPAHRSIFETDLQLTIIIIPDRDIFGKPCANSRYLYGLRARHLAHHVDVVDPAIHDRAQTFHLVTM